MNLSKLLLPLLLGASLVAQRQPSGSKAAEQDVKQPSTGAGDDDLKKLVGGDKDEPFLARLAMIAKLLEAKDAVLPTANQMLTGDHREILIKVRKLVEGLADDRWAVREESERMLVEIGGRAKSILEKAKNDQSAILEVRIRVERALREIENRGANEELVIARQVRLLAEACAYLKDPSTLEPLISATGHTDDRVREAAVRALGFLGLPEAVPALSRLAGDPLLTLRNAAVSALSCIPGEKAQSALAEIAKKAELPTSVRILAIRGLKAQAPSHAALAELSKDASPNVRAAVLAPALPHGPPVAAKIHLVDGGVIEKELLGIKADAVMVRSPVDGLTEVLIPLPEIDHVELKPGPVESGKTRLFLRDGTLLSGEVRSMADGVLVFASTHLGERRIPLDQVHGIALDPKLGRLVGNSRQHDRVRTGTAGEMVEGTVEAISAQGIVIRGENKETRTIPLASATAILMKAEGAQTPIDPGDHLQMARVELGNNERVVGYLLDAGGGGVALAQHSLGPVMLQMDRVQRLQFGVGGSALSGYSLVADYSANRVFEVDGDGKETWALEDVAGPWDARYLDNGNVLVTEYSANRVREFDRAGKKIWEFSDLKTPYSAERLPGGNTLIADAYNDRVIEVYPTGEIVWQFKNCRPYNAERLPNGNTLIADYSGSRVIEVDRGGKIVWKLDNMVSVHDADRLPNGNTLITLRQSQRVIEVDRQGRIVFEIRGLNTPSDADRLPNGNTIVAEYQMVREFDRFGKPVWQKDVEWAGEVNRY